MLDLHCPRCGRPTDLDVCMCCTVASVVCHPCELLLGRYGPDELAAEMALTIPRSATAAGQADVSEKGERRRD